MKPLVFLLAFLFVTSMNAQSPRYPAKPTVPEKPLQLGKNELLNAGKLSAIYYRSFDMDSTTLEIKNYKVSIFANGHNPVIGIISNSDSIPARVLELLKTYGAKLIRHGFCSMAKIDEKDRYNRKARLTAEHAKATTVRNNAFNPEAFK